MLIKACLDRNIFYVTLEPFPRALHQFGIHETEITPEDERSDIWFHHRQDICSRETRAARDYLLTYSVHMLSPAPLIYFTHHQLKSQTILFSKHGH